MPRPAGPPRARVPRGSGRPAGALSALAPVSRLFRVGLGIVPLALPGHRQVMIRPASPKPPLLFERPPDHRVVIAFAHSSASHGTGLLLRAVPGSNPRPRLVCSIKKRESLSRIAWAIDGRPLLWCGRHARQYQDCGVAAGRFLQSRQIGFFPARVTA